MERGGSWTLEGDALECLAHVCLAISDSFVNSLGGKERGRILESFDNVETFVRSDVREEAMALRARSAG